MKNLITTVLFMLTISMSAQNFNGFRTTLYLGSSQGEMEKTYGYAEGICVNCQPVELDLMTNFDWAVGKERMKAMTYGLGIGYNYSIGSMIVGWDLSGFKYGRHRYNLYGDNIRNAVTEGPFVSNVKFNGQINPDLLIGVAINKVMLYAKGGASLGHFGYYGKEGAYAVNEWNAGYNYGAGIKYAITPRVAIGVEYGRSVFNLEQATKNKVYSWNGTVTTKQNFVNDNLLATITIGFGRKAAKSAQVVYRNAPVITDTVYVEKEPAQTAAAAHSFPAPEVGKIIRLENIFYNFDKWDIRPDARPDLEQLVAYMNEYPNMKIELSSHTDSRGSKEYNETLSQKRAQSAVDYIIQRGISKDRITARGYGESVLTNNCSDGVNCNENEHQANRRTEFTIKDI